MTITLLLALPAFADNQSDTNRAATEQAKQDYKVFLEQLKALNGQYKEITNQIKEVVKEEGVPTIDDETGEMQIVKPDADWGDRKQNWAGPSFGEADIKETNKEMIVKIDLPGAKKEELKVRLENNRVLRVYGQSDSVRLHGRFQRRVELPALARESGIDARYENGVLTVRVPKAVESQKEISVSVQ